MKPRPLHPGATIAVVAPASAPKDPAALDTGVAALRARGYRVEIISPTMQQRGYLAGPDAARLDALNHTLRRDDVHALFCVRGGYGSLRLLPHLDYEAARRHPKLLVGYSDITALHLAFYLRAGWTGLSGPLVVEWGNLDAAIETQFWALARGATPSSFTGPSGEELQPLRPGTAEGVLLGGNLSMITRLIGTPYLPSLDGALLFVEDVGEQPYRLDALFAQLHLTGLLEHLGGLLIGGFTEWEPDHARPTLTPEEVVADYLNDAPFPVASGLVYGHFPQKSTVPVGVRARLSVTGVSARLAILEPVVEEAAG